MNDSFERERSRYNDRPMEVHEAVVLIRNLLAMNGHVVQPEDKLLNAYEESVNSSLTVNSSEATNVININRTAEQAAANAKKLANDYPTDYLRAA